MKLSTRVVCIKDCPRMGYFKGDTGTLVFGADYVPGWDAGKWTVQPDNFPENSPYHHNAVNYWTETEMLESWAYSPNWVGERG